MQTFYQLLLILRQESSNALIPVDLYPCKQRNIFADFVVVQLLHKRDNEQAVSPRFLLQILHVDLLAPKRCDFLRLTKNLVVEVYIYHNVTAMINRNNNKAYNIPFSTTILLTLHRSVHRKRHLGPLAHLQLAIEKLLCACTDIFKVRRLKRKNTY